MNSRWLIVQNGRQALWASSLFQDGSRWNGILATAPEPFYLLQQKGLPVLGLHQFAEEEELNQLAWMTFHQCQKIVSILIDVCKWPAKQWPTGFDPFFALPYQVKVSADRLCRDYFL